MEITPIPGVPGITLITQLKDAERELDTVKSGDAVQVFVQYFKWANRHAGVLGNYLVRQDLDQFVTTPRYWTLQGLIPLMNASIGALPTSTQINVNGLLHLEIDERKREMGQIIKEMEDRLNHWKKVDGALFIADTNIYLHQEVEFQELDWENITEAGGRGAHLVIPLLVLVELDRHKRINGKVVSKTNNMPVRTRARMTLRYVNELFKETSESQVLKLANPPFGPVTTSLLLDNPRHSPLPDPDSEFLDRTRALKDFIDRDVCVLTSDSSMAFRARAIGLKVKRLPDN